MVGSQGGPLFRYTEHSMIANLDETEGLASVELVLRLLEFLAHSARPRGVSEIARALGISKTRAHRHLRALVARGYARQEAHGDLYEVTVRLMVLGEAVRDRFDVLSAMRPQMGLLREATGQAVTASALVDGALVILELLHGRTLIEFGVRPGATLDLHSSAHGLVALAFGPPHLLAGLASAPLPAWTSRTVTRFDRLEGAVAAVRAQGWASAADQMMVGVNALAAPVFDHRRVWRGTLALVGSTQFIAPRPDPAQIEAVTDAAAAASRQLGWRREAA